MPEFTRFTETITKKQDKRVVNITVKPTVIDCTGSVWFTDLMLQEGDKVTGFVINTETFLEKYDGDDATDGKRFYNGIVRSAATCVIFNLGTTAAGLDYSHHREELMKRIRELQDFIAGQETDITEFDEALVKKLIEKITVFTEHFTVEFKSGITIEIEA